MDVDPQPTPPELVGRGRGVQRGRLALHGDVPDMHVEKTGDPSGAIMQKIRLANDVFGGKYVM